MKASIVYFGVPALILLSSCVVEENELWLTVPDHAVEVSVTENKQLSLETIFYQVSTVRGSNESFNHIKRILTESGFNLCASQVNDWHYYESSEVDGEQLKGDRFLAYFLKPDHSYSVSLSILEVCASEECKHLVAVSRKDIVIDNEESANSLDRFCETGSW